MSAVLNYFSHLYSCYTIYRILTYERIEQKFVLGVDPKIYEPSVRNDLEEYVNSLLSEFDYHDLFVDKKSFYPILFMRRLREDHRLSNWMNKIWLSEHLDNLGVPSVKKHYASYDKAPSIELLSSLENYVAKPAHLSEGDSVFIVANDIDLKTGRPVEAALVCKRLSEALSARTVSWDTWGTRNTKPGVIVEEMSADKSGNFDSMCDELKIYCVWGKVYFGVWRRGDVYQNGGFLYRDHYVDNLDTSDHAWWKTMIEYAETVAEGTDFLRVDMFINGGQPVVSEVEIMPATPVPRPLQTQISDLLNTGYSLHS